MITSKFDCIVVGGGVAGLTAALQSAAAGLRVLLLEKSAHTGGKAAAYCCQATDRCLKCGACLAVKLNNELNRQPLIDLRTLTSVRKCEKTGGGFNVTVEADPSSGAEVEETVYTKTVVFATGFEPFNLSRKKQYRFGQAANVVSAAALSKQLISGKLARPSDGAVPESIAFLQCVGSRNRKEQVNCSRVCCGYTTRLALLIRRSYPDTALTRFYIDLQPCGRDSEQIYKMLAKAGIRQVRSIPAEAEELGGGDIRLTFENRETGGTEAAAYSMVVLSTGIPGADINRQAAKVSLLKLNKDGFISAKGMPPGMFVTGSALRPMDIEESVCHAGAIAARVVKSVLQ